MLQATPPVLAASKTEEIAGVQTKPLSWRLGTEVSGLNLRHSEGIPQETISGLWRLLGERGILLFRGQGLNHEQHLALVPALASKRA